MERPTRRSATAANGLSSTSSNGTNSNNSNNSSRRRRREADRDGAMSDGGDTDSSTVAVEMGTSARSSKTSATKKSARSTATARGKSLAGVDAIVEAAATDAVDDAGRADDDDVNFEDPVQEDDAPGANVDAQEEEPPLVTGYATRARRERSQSVVSTTSDTSSIASTSSRPGHGEDDDEDEDGEPPRLEVHTEKLAELEKKKKMVEDGSLAEYCRRVAEFKEERNRLLQSAEWHKNLQLKNTADLFGFEVQRGHNLWQESKDTLKREMLTRADTLLRTLRGELATLEETGRLPTHVVQPKKTLALPPRKVAVTVVPGGGDVGGTEETLRCSVGDKEEADDEADHEEEEEEEQQDRSIYKRRKVVATSAPMPANVLRLPLDTIYSDLASILTTRETASAAIHTALPAARLEVRVDRRRLLCGKYVFEEGDEVVVTAAVLKEDYIGVISSVSDQELFVKLSTGQKVRVAVEHIAYRRCEIRPFLRGSAGIQSLQSSGWVECEPF